MPTQMFLIVAVQQQFTVVLVTVTPVVSIIVAAFFLAPMSTAGEISAAGHRRRQTVMVLANLWLSRLAGCNQIPDEVADLFVAAVVTQTVDKLKKTMAKN